ncbi:MAG: phenylalanine--tRNA ligase subunit beta [Planctomycetes bacterium]|nr:phenylalanine--tRNA ligase subunit beta [Planctomycetota bacterium]
MMKATASWIDSYVGTGLSAQEIADKLTLSGTEVEKMEDVAGDVCFTLEVTSNRTDCLSVIGLARELAACTGKVVNHPKVALKTGAKASDVSSVTIEPDALAACPYYSARVIKGVKVGPSPEWLQKRLEGIGLKPINNVVDITNFVLFETGQPLHAFDLNKLKGKRIVVRMAGKDEPFRPVVGDGAAIKLDESTLVIGDAARPQAVGGVMGGFESGVTLMTKDVLLESAYFNPQSIRATSRRLGMESDSSYRFERDVDQGGVLRASERAAQLIAEIAGGEVLEGVLEAGELKPHTRKLTVTEAEVERMLGIRVPHKQMETILRGLDLDVAKSEHASVHAEIPSFRRDLERSIDLVEEIARVHGLDNIPADLRMVVETAKPSRRQKVRRLVRSALQGMGFSEALTDTFTTAKTTAAASSPFSKSPVRLEARNPVNAELPSLRRNLMSSLLLALGINQRQGRDWVRQYEVANVWLPSGDGKSAGEREVLGLIGSDYFDLKGAIETLLESLRCTQPVEVSPLTHELFAEGRAATVKLGGKLFGVIGEPAAKAAKEYDVEGTCAVAELDFGLIVDAWLPVPTMEELPRFPTAERDLAFVLDHAVTWAQIEATARAAADNTLRGLELFDEFTGKQLGAGKKSLAFRLYFRHDDKTLTSEEIQAQTDAVVKAITDKLGGALRA